MQIALVDNARTTSGYQIYTIYWEYYKIIIQFLDTYINILNQFLKLKKKKTHKLHKYSEPAGY